MFLDACPCTLAVRVYDAVMRGSCNPQLAARPPAKTTSHWNRRAFGDIDGGNEHLAVLD